MTPALVQGVIKNPNGHVKMCKHDMLVSTCILNLHTVQYQSHTNKHMQSLSRESACEFGNAGEEKCKCSSFQVGDMASMGRQMCACERKWEMAKERERCSWITVCSLCPPCPDAHRSERTWSSGSKNRWRSQENVWLPTSPSLFNYVSDFVHPLSLFLFFLKIMVVFGDAEHIAAYFPLSSFTPLPSSCCISCIVRLQVWEQGLWEHMHVGETLWLTWLLRRRDSQKETQIKADTIQEHFLTCFWFLQ